VSIEGRVVDLFFLWKREWEERLRRESGKGEGAGWKRKKKRNGRQEDQSLVQGEKQAVTSCDL
jgi:hypothetical protein